MNLNKIGEGTGALVYKKDNYALKIYNENTNKFYVFFEAYITSLVEQYSIPMAKVYEVLEYDNKIALKMDYISGESLNDIMLKDKDNYKKYLNDLVHLQMKINSEKVNLPITTKDRLRRSILSVSKLNEVKKFQLLDQLEKLPDGNKLCHGDFHGLNIIRCNDGEYKVIDWVDASVGCEDADICRTYMIHYFYAQDIAEEYLDLYCKLANKNKKHVLRWLPVVAAARLTENDNEKEEYIIKCFFLQ